MSIAKTLWATVVRMHLEGLQQKEIAEQLGVSQPSISRTLALPEVRARIAAERASLLDHATQLLANGTSRAVTGLLEIGEDAAQPGAVRVRAYAEILDRAGVTRGAVQVEHTGTVEHVHARVSVDELRLLPESERARQLARIRAELAGLLEGDDEATPDGADVIDAEGWDDDRA